MTKRNIIDTFLFSEPFEKDLLLAKLSSESPGVSRWVIVENAYTFQGEQKGNCLAAIINEDERFEPFRERIEVISCDIKFPPIDPHKDPDQQGIEAEHRQRQQAYMSLTKVCAEDDWVVISDTDEIVDCSDPSRLELLHRHIDRSRTGMLPLPRIRYWYDFDNLWPMRRSTPIVAAKRLFTSEETIGWYRLKTIGRPTRWAEELVFEYSFCFSLDWIIRKYETFTHPGFELSEIKNAIRCNRTPVAERQRLSISLDESFWLRPVTLSAQNSPTYIREHLEDLKTNVVPSDFATHRRTSFPELFNPAAQLRHRLGKLSPRHLRRLARRLKQSRESW
nr:hypothetical protein [Rhodopirellula sp. SM50]